MASPAPAPVQTSPEILTSLELASIEVLFDKCCPTAFDRLDRPKVIPVGRDRTGAPVYQAIDPSTAPQKPTGATAGALAAFHAGAGAAGRGPKMTQAEVDFQAIDTREGSQLRRAAQVCRDVLRLIHAALDEAGLMGVRREFAFHRMVTRFVYADYQSTVSIHPGDGAGWYVGRLLEEAQACALVMEDALAAAERGEESAPVPPPPPPPPAPVLSAN